MNNLWINGHFSNRDFHLKFISSCGLLLFWSYILSSNNRFSPRKNLTFHLFTSSFSTFYVIILWSNKIQDAFIFVYSLLKVVYHTYEETIMKVRHIILSQKKIRKKLLILPNSTDSWSFPLVRQLLHFDIGTLSPEFTPLTDDVPQDITLNLLKVCTLIIFPFWNETFKCIRHLSNTISVFSYLMYHKYSITNPWTST